MTTAASDQMGEGDLPDVGEVLQGEYRLTDIVASGGMGVIMQATHMKMERDVAVKLLHPHMASQTKQVQRFEREIQLAKVLSHPNVIQVFDYGRTESGALFIVMEYLEGRDLKAMVDEEGPIGLEQACNIALQVLDGLAEAHDSEVIHRDLKPSNIFLMRRRRGGDHVKVLDFGVAKSLKGDATSITAAGQTCGTATYMPPESFLRGFPGKQGDVYAVGLIILEMLFGERVIEKKSIHQTLIQHVQQPLPMPAALVDTPVGEVLETGTAKHPDDRYPDADAMLRDLATAVDRMETDIRIDPSDRVEFGTYVDEVFPEMQSGSDDVLDSLRLDAAESASERATPSAADGSGSGEHGEPRAADSDGSSSAEEVYQAKPTVKTQTDPSAASDELPDPPQPGGGATSSSGARPRADASRADDAEASDSRRPAWLLPATAGAGVTLAIFLMFAFTRSTGPSNSTPSPASTDQRAAASASDPQPAAGSGASESATTSPPADDPPQARALMSTSPSGARIVIDGKQVGTTPKLLEFDAETSPVEVHLEKEGFESATTTIDPGDAKPRYYVDLEPTADRDETPSASAESEPSEEPTPDRSDEAPSRQETASTGDNRESDQTDSAPDDSERTTASSEESSPSSGDSDRGGKRGNNESADPQKADENYEEIAEEFTLD